MSTVHAVLRRYGMVPEGEDEELGSIDFVETPRVGDRIPVREGDEDSGGVPPGLYVVRVVFWESVDARNSRRPDLVVERFEIS